MGAFVINKFVFGENADSACFSDHSWILSVGFWNWFSRDLESSFVLSKIKLRIFFKAVCSQFCSTHNIPYDFLEDLLYDIGLLVRVERFFWNLE